VHKIPTLFQRDPDDRAHVLPTVTPGCEWVLNGIGTPLRKYDGTCVLLDNDGSWWARREVKPGKKEPAGFRAVQHDDVTGKTVGWEPIGQSSFARCFEQALDFARAAHKPTPPGTYELLGPKINGNPERWERHGLLLHASAAVVGMPRTITFESLRGLFLGILAPLGYEGVVWHREVGVPGTQMAKLKVRDFLRDSEAGR